MAFPDIDDLPGPVRDLLDVTVGLGLLTFQRVQVQRRAFEKQIEKIEPDLPDPARSVARNLRAVSETVGEGLARLLVPGSTDATSARHEPIPRPTEREPDPEHSQDTHSLEDHSQDAGPVACRLDNHLDGLSARQRDDEDRTQEGLMDQEDVMDQEGLMHNESESSDTPDETLED